MYLENIFSAPDIKQQMPLESSNFDACDRFIKTHVNKLKMSPKINKVAKPPSTLDKFNENVKMLEEI
jgi:hypothetical protein